MRERIIMCVLFLIAALCCIGAGVYVSFFHTNGYVATTGTITRIEVDHHPGVQKTGSKTTEKVYVEYKVDGVRYESMSDIYDSSYHVGKEIKIFYDPADPSRIRGEGTKLGYFFIGIGIIVIPFALLCLKENPKPKGQYDFTLPFGK